MENGLLIREAHGCYTSKDNIKDPYALIQKQNKKVVFSNETALYLHELCDKVAIFTLLVFRKALIPFNHLIK